MAIFADSVAAELPGRSQTPLFFPVAPVIPVTPVSPVSPVTPARKTGKTRKTGRTGIFNFPFSIFNFQFPQRVHIARRVQGLVLILLRSLLSVNEEAKSKA